MNQKSYNKVILKYEILGIKDYKLRNSQDLKKIYNIDISKIKGYKDLLINKSMFEGFIINFFNSIGLESRAVLKPISVKFIKDNISYLRFDYREGKNNSWLHVRGVNRYY